MEYQKFLEFVKENLAELLPEGTEIEICRIPRNNSVIIDSIVVYTPGNSLYPSIPVNPLYEQYKNGESMTSILQQIKNCLYEGLSKEETLMQAITDPAAVRANVVCRLVNRKRNEKVLKEIPYKPYLDLAVTYHYELEGLKDKRGSIMIRNEFMETWNLTARELDKLAAENTKRMFPMQFGPLEAVMREVFGTSLSDDEKNAEGCPLYLLTNTQQAYGAFWITDRDALDRIADTMGGDFFVLPSSVHECMILRASGGWDEQSLVDMVTDINRACVSPQDYLADSVYRYRKEDGKLQIACSNSIE